MINYETVAFIGMLNELAENRKYEKAKFIPIGRDAVNDMTRLLNAVGFRFCYDVTKLANADESYVYFPLVKRFGKGETEMEYYPHVFVAFPKNNAKQEDFTMFAFAEDDFNWDKAFIISAGNWSAVKDL
jgi:hypothetical protein